MNKLKFKIGDYFKKGDCIGKIVCVTKFTQPVEWEVNMVIGKKSLSDFGIFASGGFVIVSYTISPMRLNRYEPATEEEYLKAVKVVQISEASINSIFQP